MACWPPGGLFTLSFLAVDSGFWQLAFPGELLLGLGLGFTFVPLANLALVGAGVHDAGAASAMLQRHPAGRGLDRHGLAGHPVGRRHHQLLRATPSPRDGTRRTRRVALQAQVEGYTTAFTWASVLLLLGAAGVRAC